MRPVGRADPAPSRWKYRLERWMLTPGVRLTLRVGVPFVLAFGGASLWFSLPDNRAAFHDMLAELQSSIENRPEFQVRLMAIDGASPVVAEAIRARLPLDFPTSSFDLDLDTMRAQVVALDAVETAKLRIKQGGTLQIDVVERVPALLWRSSDGLELLDADGVRVGTAQSRFDHAALPVMAGEVITAEAMTARAALRQATLAGPDARQAFGDENPDQLALAQAAGKAVAKAVRGALELDAASAPLRSRLRGFERMGARRWDVVLDRGQRILLPETGAVEALERIIAMDQAVDMLARDITAVDLRLPRRPTVRMTDNATAEMWRIKEIEAGGEQRQ